MRPLPARQGPQVAATPASARSGWGEVVAWAVAAVCLILCCSVGIYSPLVDHWRRPIVFDSSRKSFGFINEGETASVSFRLTNRSGRPVRVVGCMAQCDCIVPDDLPFAIGPGQAQDFRVSVRTVAGQYQKPLEKLTQPITLYTTDVAQAEVRLTVEGTVLGTEQAAGSY